LTKYLIDKISIDKNTGDTFLIDFGNSSVEGLEAGGGFGGGW
jgi:hypothetical protein